MENVTLEDIRRHYKNTHTAKNMRFIIAGNLPPARRRLIKSLLNNIELPKGVSRLALPHEKPARLRRPLYITNQTVENVYFYLDTFLHRRLDEPEIDALSLLNMMLTETLYSKILGAARERGLVYGMSSGYGQTKNSSNWWFGAQVMPNNATLLFDIIDRELISVFNGQIADEDISSAKQYALGRYQRSGQTVGGTSRGYSGRYFFDGVIEDYYQIPERLEKVSKEAIIDTSKAMFNENVWGLGVLGSCGEEFVSKLYKQISPLWKSNTRALKPVTISTPEI